MSSFFQQELKDFKNSAKSLNEDILNYLQGIEFGSSTLYDPSNWNSLVHYHALNGDGSDEVGSLTLNEVNSPSYVSAVDGQGVALDSSSNQELVNNVDSLSPTSAITVAVWFNLSDVSHINSVYGHVADAVGAPSFNIATESDATFSCYLNVGGTTVNTKPSGTATTLTKYFVALTYDGSTITAYRDGNNNVSTRSESGDVTYSGDQLNIGNESNAGVFADANYVDEALIFDSALSSEEINDLYQAGA